MKKWFILIIGLILIAGGSVFLSFILYFNGVDSDIKARGTSLALNRTPIRQVDQVDVYYGKEECIVVQGKDDKGNPRIAWFVGNTSEWEDATRIITEKSVIDKLKGSNEYAKMQMIHIVPGKERDPQGNRKFWEVLFRDENNKYHYCYVDMYTGKMVTYNLEKAA